MNGRAHEDAESNARNKPASGYLSTWRKWIALARVRLHVFKPGVTQRRAASAFAGIFALWLGYVVVIDFLAYAVTRDESQLFGHGVGGQALTEKNRAVERVGSKIPPLARWDSFWLYDIAAHGYTGVPSEHNEWPIHGARTEFRPGFLPLYPLAMRVVAEVFSVGLFTAGLWVSRLSLLLALCMLVLYGQSHGATEDGRWEPLVAILFFPSAFILVSVYTESLFLAMVLCSFVLANRGWYLSSAGAALLAGLTRINGLALIPALLVLGWLKWRKGEQSLRPFAPAIGATAAYCLLGMYFHGRLGDPFAYLTAKKLGWGAEMHMPWTTLETGIVALRHTLVANDFGSIYVYLELPCLLLVTGCTVELFASHRWPEATFVTVSCTLSLLSGTLWGLPRFTLFLFPVFLVIASLQRRTRVVWYLYLLFGGIVQAGVLVNYVNGAPPAP